MTNQTLRKREPSEPICANIEIESLNFTQCLEDLKYHLHVYFLWNLHVGTLMGNLFPEPLNPLSGTFET